MDPMLIHIFILVGILIAGTSIGRYIEKRDFNNGYCKHCNTKLRRFDTDSQGGRGYVCDKCRLHVWVSYKVDKNYVM